ncbi:hypothetical protein [Paracoccus mutanolyticus]
MKRLIPILVALLAWSWPALAQDDPDPRRSAPRTRSRWPMS